MNIVDIIIAICLVAAMIYGAIKGFISQAISIISVFVGLWASGRFAGLVCGWLEKHFTESEQILRIVAFALIFILVAIGLYFLGKLIEGVIKKSSLGWANRLAGSLFSAIKWILILSVIVIAFDAVNEAFGLVDPEKFQGSHLYPLLNTFADTVFPYIKNLLNA